MTETQELTSMVTALIKAVTTHGADNTFAPSELYNEYGCQVIPRRMGLLARRNPRELSEIARRAGYTARYLEGRFEASETIVPPTIAIGLQDFKVAKGAERPSRMVAIPYDRSFVPEAYLRPEGYEYVGRKDSRFMHGYVYRDQEGQEWVLYTEQAVGPGVRPGVPYPHKNLLDVRLLLKTA